MPNEVFLKLVSSEFSGDEASQIDYASIVGYALDSTPKKAKLEGIYSCYVPFFAVKINEGNYLAINALQTQKNKISVSKIPDVTDIKKVLNTKYNSLEEQYKAIEKEMTSKQVYHLEISGALVRKSIEGLAKLITQHSSRTDSKYKKIHPLVTRENIKREIQTVSKYVVTETELESLINKMMDDVEQYFEKVIVQKKKEKEQVNTKYQTILNEKKEEINTKIQEINKEEDAEKKLIDQDSAKEKKELLHDITENTRWNQLKKDLVSLQESYDQLKSRIEKVTTVDQIEGIVRTLREIQDDTQSFGVGVNSTLSDMEYRKMEFSDIGQQSEVDKRNVSDKMSTYKEDIKRQIPDIENEKNTELSEKETEIRDAQNLLKKFNVNRSLYKKQIQSNYVIVSDYSLSGDLLGASEAEGIVTINVPVAICKYKASNKLSYTVLPPYSIPNKMKKPRSHSIRSTNSRIGFDCMAVEVLSFLKHPLETTLATSPDLQVEIQGDNNEIISNGDLSTLNTGLKILEQRKSFPTKNADAILALSRELLS